LFDIFDEQGERVYSAHVTGIDSIWIHNAVLMIVTDVTQIRGYEQIRREFFANASHELKTPITSIGGFAELLSTGMVKDEEKVREYIHRIKTESDRMTNLINDILQISYLEENSVSKKKERVNVLEVAQAAAASLMPQAANLDVQISMEGQNCYIDADRSDITQLFINLIDNAIKYNVPQGQVFVQVTEVDGTCTISVRDTGIGIPRNAVPRIFERFYRVDKGRSKSVGGTGLGLSIVKHIVGSYSGEININSHLGTGTEFVVKLDAAV